MATLYVAAGINHFANPELYLKIMPPYIPWHLTMVHISGVAEIGLGFFVVIQRCQRLASFGIIALLIAVFPANIYMLTSQSTGSFATDWPLWVRLPFQGVLIYWAWIYTQISQPQ